MNAFTEPRQFSREQQSFVAFGHVADRFPFRWHCHPEFELTLIESGSGTRFVGDHSGPFKPDDLVLIGGGLPHTWSSEAPMPPVARSHRALIVHFDAGLLVPGAPEFLPVRKLLGEAARGCVFPVSVARAHVRRLRGLSQTTGIEGWQSLTTLLFELAASDHRTLASADYRPSGSEGQQRRIERALAETRARSDAEDLSLAEIARTVHLSPAAFSRLVKRGTGERWIDHLNSIRVANACRALVDSDHTVAEIAYSCGFGTISNFNRRFKALRSLTPSRYRARFR